MGLSPRVRGSLIPPRSSEHRLGSIPARAGEPLSYFTAQAHAAVYPRACGGTLGGSSDKGAGSGLSPRVRGNRTAHHSPHTDISIRYRRRSDSMAPRSSSASTPSAAATRAHRIGLRLLRTGFGHDSHANTIRSAFSDRSFWAARWAVARTSYARVFMVNDLPDLAQMW